MDDFRIALDPSNNSILCRHITSLVTPQITAEKSARIRSGHKQVNHNHCIYLSPCTRSRGSILLFWLTEMQTWCGVSKLHLYYWHLQCIKQVSKDQFILFSLWQLKELIS